MLCKETLHKQEILYPLLSLDLDKGDGGSGCTEKGKINTGYYGVISAIPFLLK